jgi:hypothetical protein
MFFQLAIRKPGAPRIVHFAALALCKSPEVGVLQNYGAQHSFIAGSEDEAHVD